MKGIDILLLFTTYSQDLIQCTGKEILKILNNNKKIQIEDNKQTELKKRREGGEEREKSQKEKKSMKKKCETIAPTGNRTQGPSKLKSFHGNDGFYH